MLVIGERINATNSSVGHAIARRDAAFLWALAGAQAAAGADYIDVNAGTGGGSVERAIADMEWLVQVVQEVADKPLAIDSEDPRVIAAAMQRVVRDGFIVNSVNADPERLNAVGSLVAQRGASVVALAMGPDGIPPTWEERLAVCDRIMDRLNALGVEAHQILFDPLVIPIAMDSGQGMVTLKTLEGIKSRYPKAKTVLGLSNVSFGLPQRKVVNRAFLFMAAYAGLDAVITDPLDAKLMSCLKVADMLRGNDPFCRGYTRAHRKGLIED